MKTNGEPIFLNCLSTQLAVALTLIINALILPAHANDSPRSKQAATPASLSPLSGFDLFAVHPTVGKANQPRTVFLQFGAPGCSDYAIAFDTSLMETQNLVVIRTQQLPGVCPLQPPVRVARYDLDFTPGKDGNLTMRWDRGGADVTIQSVPGTVASKFDVNGMWFDSATNGSGIALHHRRVTTDVVFGTWFLFNNNGESRWYTLQNANWQQDGSVLEGLLIELRGKCFAANLAACPAPGNIDFDGFPGTKFGAMPARARITFSSATRARADVLTFAGTLLFTSDMTRIQF